MGDWCWGGYWWRGGGKWGVRGTWGGASGGGENCLCAGAGWGVRVGGICVGGYEGLGMGGYVWSVGLLGGVGMGVSLGVRGG